jgi:hypothetical protein
MSRQHLDNCQFKTIITAKVTRPLFKNGRALTFSSSNPWKGTSATQYDPKAYAPKV